MSKKYHTGNKSFTEVNSAAKPSISVSGDFDSDLKTVDLNALESEAGLSGYDVTLQNYEQTSGPLPSPRILKGYAELDSSLPERIFSMTEKQLDHEIDMDRKNVELNKRAMEKGFASAHRGQWIGAFLVLALIGSSVFVALNNHDGVAIAMIGTGLAVVLGAFVKDHFKKT